MVLKRRRKRGAQLRRVSRAERSLRMYRERSALADGPVAKFRLAFEFAFSAARHAPMKAAHLKAAELTRVLEEAGLELNKETEMQARRETNGRAPRHSRA